MREAGRGGVRRAETENCEPERTERSTRSGGDRGVSRASEETEGSNRANGSSDRLGRVASFEREGAAAVLVVQVVGAA